MSRTTQTLVVAALIVAVGMAGAISQLTRGSDVDQQPPDPGTFRILSEPQNDADRAVIDLFQGDTEVDLSDARLLGTDRWGRHYVLVEDRGRICFLVITGAESAAGACDSADEVLRRGTWLKGGGEPETPDYLAVVRPDEYADATVRTSQKQVLRTPNLLVYETEWDTADTVVIRSDRYQDITITTAAR